MLKCHDSDAAIPHGTRVWDVGEQQAYLLNVEGVGDAPARELEVQATSVIAAIERAVIVFGAGEVEIRSADSRGYRLKIHGDRSWSLQPLYQL